MIPSNVPTIAQHILDPAPALDPHTVGLARQGVKLVNLHGFAHIMDWVGKDSYPSPSDFVDEAIRMGISRRVQRSVAIHRLRHESRLLLVHEHAFVHEERRVPMLDESMKHYCPLAIPDHEALALDEGVCSGAWWSFARGGWKTSPGIFMSVPISRVEVIAGASESETIARELDATISLEVRLVTG
jgi:Arc/MetJ-type ribon-helix-helix transcriptional regulator